MGNHLTEKEILYEIIDAISTLSVEDLLKKVDRIIGKVTGADSTTIYLVEEETNTLLMRASHFHPHLVGKFRLTIGKDGIAGEVAHTGSMVVLNKGVPLDKRFFKVPGLHDESFEAMITVPFKSNGLVVGVMNIKFKTMMSFEPEKIELIETIGKLVGKAIEHAILLERSHDLKEALETQNNLNKAKIILMKEKSISETEAYNLLRKAAMSKRVQIKDIAKAVVTLSDAKI